MYRDRGLSQGATSGDRFRRAIECREVVADQFSPGAEDRLCFLHAGEDAADSFFQDQPEFFLVDLPGYGYAKAPMSVRMQWGPMIETYLTKRKQLKGIVLLIDLRHPAAFLDQEMKKWLDHFQVPTLYVATKADKIGRNQRKEQIEAVKASFGISDVIVTSAESKEGRDLLWKEVERVVMQERAD
ncbi:MAG: ribosome biogenesis GTP-binding protein YihA/YsxC [Candidatus Manganitrophus sp.]|nr:MAG: ribosome biogenesis GTP-binding protein YihA/YsxC [Candidatus Manganitrophus sp.]